MQLTKSQNKVIQHNCMFFFHLPPDTTELLKRTKRRSDYSYAYVCTTTSNSDPVLRYIEKDVAGRITPKQKLLDIVQSDRWTTSISEMPSKQALDLGIQIIEFTSTIELIADKITPSYEGGIIFEYVLQDNTYLAIEIDNDGDMALLESINDVKNIRDLNFESLKEVLENYESSNA